MAEGQAGWAMPVPRANQPCLLGSLLITIDDVNDNAPYFLPENKTFGKHQPSPCLPALYSARTAFGQLPWALLKPQVGP